MKIQAPWKLAALLAESNGARTLAEDRLSAKQEECDWLRRELETARAEALNAVKAAANVAWQQRYGCRLYPETAGLPEGASHEETPGPVKIGPSQIRQLKRAALQQFVEQGRQEWEEAHKQQAS